MDEGWLRCAECNARIYADLYEMCSKLRSGQVKNKYIRLLTGYRSDIEFHLRRARRNVEFTRPSEYTCAYCTYEKDYVEKADQEWEPFTTMNKLVKKLKKKYGELRLSNVKEVEDDE